VAGEPDEVSAALSRYEGAVPVVNPVGDLDAHERAEVRERVAP
jgi:hypothetical protein